MKKGQAAFEYMILVGALLVVLIPLFYYVSYYSSQNVKVEKLEDAVQTLGRTTDSLYSLGPGNKDYVIISLPGAISETKVSGTEILIKIDIFGDTSDFYYTTKGPVTGSIPTEQGNFEMEIEVLENGTVQIQKS
ncbi:class III signal peptide-containing protein [Candidatus Woesearchaeota archaeon]|nr:class III signal peptide-containing protein [Candidatus Woesearchaeota archaeon]